MSKIKWPSSIEHQGIKYKNNLIEVLIPWPVIIQVLGSKLNLFLYYDEDENLFVYYCVSQKKVDETLVDDCCKTEQNLE